MIARRYRVTRGNLQFQVRRLAGVFTEHSEMTSATLFGTRKMKIAFREVATPRQAWQPSCWSIRCWLPKGTFVPVCVLTIVAVTLGSAGCWGKSARDPSVPCRVEAIEGCNFEGQSNDVAAFSELFLSIIRARCESVETCCLWDGFCEHSVERWQGLLQPFLYARAEERADPAHLEPSWSWDCESLAKCAKALVPCRCSGLVSSPIGRTWTVEGESEEAPVERRWPDDCRLALRGPVVMGEGCVTDWECGGECVCHRSPGLLASRQCMPLARQSEACGGNDSCSVGLLCVGGVCMPPGNDGDGCTGTLEYCEGEQCRIGTCKFGLQCVEGHCIPLRRRSESCNPLAGIFCDRFTYCDCDIFFTGCDGAGACVDRLEDGANCSHFPAHTGRVLEDRCIGWCAAGSCAQPMAFGEFCVYDKMCEGWCSSGHMCWFDPNPEIDICFSPLLR
jgi:hypothetical protein